MNVGDYVRTKDGIISRIESISDFIYTDIDCYGKHYIKKSSPQIIDLIEVGDYVNGSYVYSIVDENKSTGRPKLLFTEEDGALGNEDIKSIVTHEQMAVEYKVGE